MSEYKEIERGQVELNQEVGERKSALERLIDTQKAADDIKENIAKRKAEEPAIIPGEDDEIRERRERIAMMAAHLEGVGGAIAEAFPSEFVVAQESQAQAGRDTLEAQQVVQDKRTQVEAARHARESRQSPRRSGRCYSGLSAGAPSECVLA